MSNESTATSAVLVYKAGELTEQLDEYTGAGKYGTSDVSEGDSIIVTEGGKISKAAAGAWGKPGGTITVKAGGIVSQLFFMEGGKFIGDGCVCTGAVNNHSGWITGAAIQTETGAIVQLNDAQFSNNTVEGSAQNACGGAVYSYMSALTVTGGKFSDNKAVGATSAGGAICTLYSGFNGIGEQTTISNAMFSGNRANYGGAVQQNGGSMLITGATFTGNAAAAGGAVQIYAASYWQDGTKYDYYAAATIKDTVFNGNTATEQGGAIDVRTRCTLDMSGVTLQTASDTIANSGTITISGVNTINADVRTSGFGEIIFDLSAATAETATVSDLGKFSGGTYSLQFETAKECGKYMLAGNAAGFSGYLTVSIGDTLTGRFSVSNGDIAGTASFRNNGKEYKLIREDNALKLEVADAAGTEDSLTAANGLITLSMATDSGANKVTLTKDGSDVSFEMLSREVKTYGLNGDWNCTSGELAAEFTSKAADNAQKFEAATDGASDIFFARKEGIWTNYQARNTNTNETKSITGLNRFNDIFAGAGDASALFLTDDANGDALFLDDIYSFGGDAARLSSLDEIRAGNGSDIIDLTSERYTAELAGLMVRGGAGDDTIWGAACNQMLFGDAGNDTIAGGASDDIICGGSGNDVLSGGGGTDIFCFSAGASGETDRIMIPEEDYTSKMIIVFESGTKWNWDSSYTSISYGNGSVIDFGESPMGVEICVGTEYAGYDKLASAGCFKDSHNSVFGESADGILAVL